MSHDDHPGRHGGARPVAADSRRNAPGVVAVRRSPLEPSLSVAAIKALARAPRFAGAVIPGSSPLLCVEARPSLRRDALEGTLRVIPWGWDCASGGVLTFSVATKGAGWLGRVAVQPSDDCFAQLSGGPARLVIVADERVLATFKLDLSTFSGDYSEQWRRVRDHVPAIPDAAAARWQALRQVPSVVEGRLQPTDRLALGWSNSYADAVWQFSRTLESVTLEIRARARERAATEKAPSVAVFMHALAECGSSASMLASWIRKLRSTDEAAFTKFVTSHTEIHDALHAIAGEAGPLCHLQDRLVQVELLSSVSTREGRVLPWLSKASGKFEHLELRPSAFPEGVLPDDYWRRVTEAIPWNWGALVDAADVHADLTTGSALWAEMPRAMDVDACEAAAGALLAEAVASKKWVIPPRAELDLQVGPFVRMTVSEQHDEVAFVLRMKTGEFAIACVEPERGFFGFSGGFAPTYEDDLATKTALKLLLAAVIRDFFVVEERESVFAFRREKPAVRRGQEDTDGPRIVYLPRVKYTSTADVERCARELNHAERRAHDVGAHLRKSVHASEHQLWLARSYGFAVPSGYTFVRPHQRGEKVREVLYRSRSAFASLYALPMEANAGRTEAAPWFVFERDVAALLKSLGFTVEHVAASRRGDGGVDVYATKGEDLDEIRWVIQCKCFAPDRPVGPSVIRELVGSLADYPRGTRGMVVTTSTFSTEARASAERAGIRLMDGAEVAQRLRGAPL